MKTWIPLVGCLALSLVSPAPSSADGDTASPRNRFIRVKATRSIDSELPDVSSPGGCARLYRTTWVRTLVRPSERRTGAESCVNDVATDRSGTAPTAPTAPEETNLVDLERADAPGLARSQVDGIAQGDLRRADSNPGETRGAHEDGREARHEGTFAFEESPVSPLPTPEDPMISDESFAAPAASIPELH